MKTLLLCRHAKSSWEIPDLTDFERPLNNRGRRDGEFMGKLLATRGFRPDHILSSPANRALTTARMIASELKYPLEEIHVEESLYEATSRDIIRTISLIDEQAATAMLFGHNPGLTTAANTLAGILIDNVPTCGMVAVELPVDSWKSVPGALGAVLFFEYPKKYLD